MHKDADKDLAQKDADKDLAQKDADKDLAQSGGEKNHRSKRKRAEAEKKLQREKSRPSNRKCAEAKKKLQRKEKRKERRIAAEKLLQREEAEERDLLFGKRRPWSRTRRTSSSTPTKSLPSTVLGDLDEMDPLHGRLEGLLDASQFALLATMDQEVRDAEFLSELESDQKGDKEQGVQLEVENKSESKRVQSVLRSRKSEHRLEKLRRREEKTEENPRKKVVTFDQETALAAIGWGPEIKGGKKAKSRIKVAPRKSTGGQSSFSGAGYGAHKEGGASARRRFKNLDEAFASGTARANGKQQRAERVARSEAETTAGENVYLAMETSSSASPSDRTESMLLDDDVMAIVDSGTTVSISTLKKRGMFENFNRNKSVTIAGFNSSLSKSNGSGTIVGYVYDVDKQRIAIRIPRVHEVPGAPHELLSVSNMKKYGFSFHFTPDESYMITPTREKVVMIEKGGLFWLRIARAHGPGSKDLGEALNAKKIWFEECNYLNQPDPVKGVDSPQKKCDGEACENCSLARRPGITNVPLDVMHRRLNHINVDLIKKMSKGGSLDVSVIGKIDPVCGVCETAKAKRKSVPKHREHEPEELQPFQRVWCDLKGKVDRDFWGNRYICTWTCESTRWSYVSFMTNKSDAKKEYIKFIEWTKLMGFTIEKLNSDSGGEYTSSNGKLTVNHNAKVITAFEQISKANKIQQNFTAPHTPEHNGVSERLNRTLVESGRALLIEAGLAKEFWSLAVKHVVYVKNRLYHSALSQGKSGMSPFQSVFGKSPRFKNLRVFGCDAWKLDHQHRSGSWSRKAKKMMFVGVSENKKGWVLFDPKSRKLVTTYHATFDESMSNRRCALRDFDLRGAKAGPGASRDENREALHERCLYDESALLMDQDVYQDPVHADDISDMDSGSTTEKDHRHPSSEEKESEEIDEDDSDDDMDEPLPSSEKQRKRTGPTGDIRRRVQGGGATRNTNPATSTVTPPQRILKIPDRRAAIGAPQGLDDDDYTFLRQAYENDLPLAFTQKNPKRLTSRKRYEKYKSATNLRAAVSSGATWNDIKWDFDRGWVDFEPTARSSHATISELLERQQERSMNSTPNGNVNEQGHPKTAGAFSGLSFEESIQQDYAHIAMECIEDLSHREQRLLEKALEGHTMTEFAHSCAARIMIDEPLTVRDAMASEHEEEWRAAMKKEIEMLTKFKCFDIVTEKDALRHGKLVKSKWVFKVKYQQDGDVERFKARLVAKGFSQRPGQDYVDGETYSPVFSYTSLRTIVSKAANDDYQLDCWDLASSFVQQPLDVDHMYMQTPDGYPKFDVNGKRTALHVRQSLYGLKQASRLLSDRLSGYLKKLGFRQLVSDRCVFVKGEGREQIIAATWVDDIVLSSARENKAGREQFDKDLRKEFEMSPWTSGETDWLLNIKVTRDWEKGTIHLSQPRAIEKLAEKFGMTGREGRNPSVPMNPALKLDKPASEDIVDSSEFDYPSAVGGMLYLSLTARPDVAQSVGVLSRFMACPGPEHVAAAKQVIKYLYATKEMGITYTKGKGGSPHLGYDNENGLETYVHTRKSSIAVDDASGDSSIMGTYADADLAGDIGTRKSTTGFCMVLNGGVINWSSKLQATVALSTAEAETIAGTEAVKQVMHMRLFLKELGQEQREPSIVWEDNMAAIALGHGSEQSKRSKHYALKVAFLNEKYKEGIFAYQKVASKLEIADALTKALPRQDFCRFREWMGVYDP